MAKHHYRVLSLLVLMLVAAQAQEINQPVIVKRYSSSLMPFPAADQVFIIEDMCVEYTLTGYASMFGQLTLKKRINLFHGTEIGIGIGLPYTIVKAKTILKEYYGSQVMLAFDFGLIEGGLELDVLTTLGKIGLSYGVSLRNGINTKIEAGYCWYAGYYSDLAPSFPRIRASYSTIAFEKNIGRKLNLGIHGGPVLSYLRFRPPLDPRSTDRNVKYVSLLSERIYAEGDNFNWTKQWFVNVGITINYDF